jgi:gamma-glutamylcyclotransferase (GGCT)/AIG2-like uncharacterized protein YtfP
MAEDAQDGIWYFGYGSNLDPDRFRERVGRWMDRRRATLPDYRLTFSADARSEGGGGAVAVPAPGACVRGAVFSISPRQLEAMDRVELDRSRDLHGRGRRETVRVMTEDGPLRAEIYLLDPAGAFLAPSPRYLQHIVDGLRDAGYPEDAIDEVTAAAQREPLPG